ncbi:MAG: ATP-binding cassette domain-containing protein [Anaerolineales bacterium]
MDQTVIETERLSVYYGRQRGVHNLDMQVVPGEVYGFLGPNGAGKTTTIRVLMDIICPTAGSAKVFGLDCQKHGKQIRQQVGYMPGELRLYAHMRADHYLAMVAAVRAISVDSAYYDSLCTRLELDTHRQMQTYSHGNRQKVGLVAAFMSKPDLLILDEPTLGLDPLAQQSVLDIVREARTEGRTVFFSSHNLSEVQSVCDRVGIIRDGQLVASEQVESLTRKQFHRLSLRFEQTPPAGVFDLSGVKEVDRIDNLITLEIRDNLNALLAEAVRYKVVDLETHPITLEEVFMAYYGEGRRNNHD